uniref:F-box domain-containing protein n=1 Tax=Graphocephala atropunctata TaxID=36148 RepID=A0A1B6KV50_9HEMI
MEKLPVEMVATIAQYLSVEELVQCCAVCRDWREVFGHDLLWKPHCDQNLAEYLRTTKSKVEPHFVVSHSEDSTLSPLGNWRISYMRQVHLWENWLLGRCFREHFDCSESAHPQHTFLTDDLILRIYGNSVGVWNVSDSPGDLHEPMCLFSQWDVDLCQTFGKGKIVVVQNNAVLVFSFEESCIKWPLDFVFFFREPQKRTGKNLEDLDIPVVKEEEIYSTRFVVVGSFFVGCQKNEQLMHVWNLETGQKLSEETLPLSATYSIKELVYSKTTKDILVAAHQERESMFNFFVYNLNRLEFLPFRAKYKSINNLSQKGCIHGNFVALRLDLNLYIHNYKTCQHIKTVNKVVADPQVLNSLFVYIENPNLFDLHPFNTLTACNPYAPDATLFLTRQDTQRFSVIGGRFYIYDRHVDETLSSGDSDAGSAGWRNLRSNRGKKAPIEYFERKVWHIRKKQLPFKTKTRVFWFRETANVVANKSCTRVISSNLTDHLSGEEQYWLHTFW